MRLYVASLATRIVLEPSPHGFESVIDRLAKLPVRSADLQMLHKLSSVSLLE
jgi:hypothetical protein